MIEAIVTCVNYGDFLAQTLPHNKSLFDEMTVVTSPEDKHTQRVCEYWNVRCEITDEFRSHFGEFHKGKGINRGLKTLSKSDWIVHMDADIMLPPLFRSIVNQADFDKTFIYGADRFIVSNYEKWAQFQHKPVLLHENKSWIHLNTFPLGTRVSIEQHGGYIPIGFFQMWHGSTGIHDYPDQHNGAGRTDMLHAIRWPRSKRAMIPELVVYHLESEAAVMGANWEGRKTKPFNISPSCVPGIFSSNSSAKEISY